MRCAASGLATGSREPSRRGWGPGAVRNVGPREKVNDPVTETWKESFKVTSAQLLDTVKRLLHEGNVRRLVIKHEGRTVAEFPLTMGVIGAVLAPVLAAVAAIAAVITECTVEVERAGDEPPSKTHDQGGAA